jgi:hypothetical protein
VWRVRHERTFLPIKGMVPIRLTAAAVSGLAKVTKPYLGVRRIMSVPNECAGRACRAVPFRFAGLLVHDELTLDHGTVVGFEETVQRRVIDLCMEKEGVV